MAIDILSTSTSREAEGPPPDVPAIRWADWRFLLPTAVPARAAFAGTEVSNLRRAVEAVCREVVVLDRDQATTDSSPSEFPLVVVEGGGPKQIRRAVAVLAENGLLYVEIDRRNARGLLFSARGTAGRLAAQGLTEVEAHWHYPSFARRRCIIPMSGVGTGLRYLRRNHDKLLLRLLSLAFRLPVVARLAEALLPCVSIIARKPLGVGRKQ